MPTVWCDWSVKIPLSLMLRCRRMDLKRKLKSLCKITGFNVIDFPYFYSKGDSAVGCYLNYLATEKSIFLPVFGVDTDNEAIELAKNIFYKTIIPVNINEIAEKGGLLNCISWEFE